MNKSTANACTYYDEKYNKQYYVYWTRTTLYLDKVPSHQYFH